MVLQDTETPDTSRGIYSEDAEGEAPTRDPWDRKTVLQLLCHTAQKLFLVRS